VAKSNHPDIAEQFVQNFGYIGQEYLAMCFNQKNDISRTPLHEDISNNSNELVQFLIDCGAALGRKDGFGQIPLHVAVLGNNLSIVKTLLEAIRDHFPRDLERYVNEVR
jgi:ankyrin repeat protein